jgi:hypothetical protein
MINVTTQNQFLQLKDYIQHYKTKFQEKLQTFLDYDMPYSTKKYDNNISMLKAFVDLNLDLTSFQKIKEQLGLGPEYF